MIFSIRPLNTLFSIATAPVWLIQGVFFKRIAIRLPEAQGINDSQLAEYDFIMLGDSVAAGVGLEHIDDALAGEIAKQLATKGEMPRWKVMGKSGFKLSDLLALIKEKNLPIATHYVISIGVNDVKGFTSIKHWQYQLTELIRKIKLTSPNAKITLIEIPPMDKFPLLKKPLASVLGARCVELNEVSHQLFDRETGANIIPISLSGDASQFAIDGFHPSNAACKLMAQEIVHFFD